MSSYAYTPANTWGTTRGGGTFSPSADNPSSAQGAIASTDAALQSGWNSVWWDNPLFWLVLVILVFLGYVMFGFNVGVKRVGEVRVKAG